MAAHTATNEDDIDAWKRTHCFSTSVRRADRALTRIYDDALRPSRLSTTQYSLLSLLARAPHPMSITEIAEIQAMDRTTLSRDLTPLVRDGLLEVVPAERDRRRRIILLTSQGHEVLTIARPLWKAAQERITREHGLTEMESLLEQLSDLTSRIR
jgi:DNA-binding MarR family transcriptional regulator